MLIRRFDLDCKTDGFSLSLLAFNLQKVRRESPAYTAGNFSIEDRNGSKNVTLKMNSRFFKLCRVYSSSLKISNVSEFSWSWLLGDRTQG